MSRRTFLLLPKDNLSLNPWEDDYFLAIFENFVEKQKEIHASEKAFSSIPENLRKHVSVYNKDWMPSAGFLEYNKMIILGEKDDCKRLSPILDEISVFDIRKNDFPENAEILPEPFRQFFPKIKESRQQNDVLKVMGDPPHQDKIVKLVACDVKRTFTRFQRDFKMSDSF